jgi:acetyl esterase
VSGAAPDGADAWTLVFDGECRFCLACVRLLGRWDRRTRLRFVPLQDARALEGLPPLDRHALERAMHLVSPLGEVWAGAAALPPMLQLLPGGGFLAVLLLLPGAEQLAAAGYRVVARNRHRLGCGSATCLRGR